MISETVDRTLLKRYSLDLLKVVKTMAVSDFGNLKIFPKYGDKIPVPFNRDLGVSLYLRFMSGDGKGALAIEDLNQKHYGLCIDPEKIKLKLLSFTYEKDIGRHYVDVNNFLSMNYRPFATNVKLHSVYSRYNNKIPVLLIDKKSLGVWSTRVNYETGKFMKLRPVLKDIGAIKNLKGTSFLYDQIGKGVIEDIVVLMESVKKPFPDNIETVISHRI